jgi:hypothetical protein
MRQVHGLMMDAVGNRPFEPAQATRQWLGAALPAPAARGLALQSVLTRLASSQPTQALQAGMALPGLALDPGMLREGMALAQAATKQWMGLQAQWLDGLAELAEEMGQFRQANTVSKYVDQEMNLVQQSLALVTTQATATARLAENIQNNLAWWLSQRAGAARTPG